jgi:peptidylprolyl isomerase
MRFRLLLGALVVVAGCSAKKEPARAERKDAAPARVADTLEIPTPTDVAAIPADAERRPSGLASKLVQAGTGDQHPTADATVTVNYSGWTSDGKMFDSSIPTHEAATFSLKSVIPGWTEGVQLMVMGEKRRFWIPEAQAYRGRPGAPAGMLVFDIELLGIEEPRKPPAPVPVAKPPGKAPR